ncbi:MAG: glycerol-3-phosphate acyltransferase [Chloroflexota bacterium]
MVNGVIAVIAGYLLGSIPTAYIAGRLARGEDIRRLGGGNIGGLNTYREVGMAAGVAVVLVDIGKGAAAVAIAYWPLQLSPPWVLATALAAILGHMWMAFLKFSGGKGQAPPSGC